jgi:hypothetical protein
LQFQRRRYSFIVVSDGGCDLDCRLEDLGNAIRKIRVDLGVSIELRRFDIHPRKDGEKGSTAQLEKSFTTASMDRRRDAARSFTSSRRSPVTSHAMS